MYYLSQSLNLPSSFTNIYHCSLLPAHSTHTNRVMSRNSEKSQSMLYRFREQQAAEMGIIDFNRARRPKAITSVDSIAVCEKWRAQVVKEIGRKVMRIQEPALSEFQIRDLNDEINKLMREKHMWEIQLRNLGRPNYLKAGSTTQTVFDDKGNEVPVVLGGKDGYRYFGRARELPDVKELIDQQLNLRKQQESQESQERKLQQLARDLPAAYYGFEGDEDTPEYKSLLEDEEKYSSTRRLQIANNIREDDSSLVTIPDSLLQVPSQKEVEAYLVERIRQKLQDQYSL